jgi:transposase InsO family protein
VATLHIELGSPWESAYCDSINSRLRDELLDGEILDNLLQERVLAQRWRARYRHWRPHTALGNQSPAAFAEQCRQQDTDRLVPNEPGALTLIAGGS